MADDDTTVTFDLARDYAGRVAARHYVTLSRLQARPNAAELVEAVLDRTAAAYEHHMESLNPTKKKKAYKTKRHA